MFSRANLSAKKAAFERVVVENQLKKLSICRSSERKSLINSAHGFSLKALRILMKNRQSGHTFIGPILENAVKSA